METVRFFFDYTSPYSYLAATRLDSLGARTGARFEWIPVYLSGVMKAANNQPPGTVPARGLYLYKDLLRWSSLYGLSFRMSPHFPLDTLRALRVTLAVKAEHPAVFMPFLRACFRAAWETGDDLADMAVLERLLAEAGGPAALVREAAGAPAWKQALRATTDEAVAAGVFGVPALVLGNDELYFGNDRLVMLEERLKRGAPLEPT
jgi:2-hydroxychromene-2-carboxylate isomerase